MYGVLIRDSCSDYGMIIEGGTTSQGESSQMVCPFYLSMGVSGCVNVCHVCSKHSESRRGCWIPWRWSYRQSSTTHSTKARVDKDWESSPRGEQEVILNC